MVRVNLSLAAKVLEEMEKNAELRRKFLRMILTELMLEPDLRLAIVNAMIREVTTKSDLVELEKKLTTTLNDLRDSVTTSINTLPSKNDFEKLSTKVSEIGRNVEELRNNFKVIEGIGERFSIIEDKISRVTEGMESLEATVSTTLSKMDESISKIGSTTTTVEERTIELRSQISRVSHMLFMIIIMVLVILVIQLLEVLKLIP